MFIEKRLTQSRNDFTATLKCEHCGHTQHLGRGYDDPNYHNNVLPAITCVGCGLNRAGQKPAIKNDDGTLHVPSGGMQQYVTFGQDHTHVIGGVVFDKDCVATYDAEDGNAGRARAFELFGPRFCFHYTEQNWHGRMAHFPRGLVEVPHD